MSTYPKSPKLLKGALIEFSERLVGPIPNVILFQYNPESITRELHPYSPPTPEEIAALEKKEKEMAQPFDPPETFSLTLELDATDALEVPEAHPVAFLSGVADRIAAMEMLLYPQEGNLLDALKGSASASLGGKSMGASAGTKAIPQKTVPVVLFAWGPGRIIPVRVTSFSVVEEAYSPKLYPIRAKVTIGLSTLNVEGLEKLPVTSKWSKEVGIAAFNFTKKQKRVLAAANSANSIESIVGMLPF